MMDLWLFSGTKLRTKFDTITTEDQDGNYGKFWFCMENMKCLCSEDSNLEVQKKSLKDFIKAVFRDIGVEKYLS